MFLTSLIIGTVVSAIKGAAVVGALAVAASIVVAFLNRKVAKETLAENGLKKGTIKDIVHSGGVARIKMDAVDHSHNHHEITIEADDYDSSEIKKHITIYS